MRSETYLKFIFTNRTSVYSSYLGMHDLRGNSILVNGLVYCLLRPNQFAGGGGKDDKYRANPAV